MKLTSVDVCGSSMRSYRDGWVTVELGEMTGRETFGCR